MVENIAKLRQWIADSDNVGILVEGMVATEGE